MTSMRARLNSKGHFISDCSIHQQKPIKWGINVLVVCESDSGYGHKFER